MRNVILIIFLSLNVYADNVWTLIYKDTKNKTSFYMMLDDFKNINNKVRFWIMQRFEEPQPPEKYSYYSLKSLVQADCSKMQIRFMAYSIYKNNNASGNAIFTKGQPFDWEDVKPNTINNAYLDIACKESN